MDWSVLVDQQKYVCKNLWQLSSKRVSANVYGSPLQFAPNPLNKFLIFLRKGRKFPSEARGNLDWWHPGVVSSWDTIDYKDWNLRLYRNVNRIYVCGIYLWQYTAGKHIYSLAWKTEIRKRKKKEVSFWGMCLGWAKACQLKMLMALSDACEWFDGYKSVLF